MVSQSSLKYFGRYMCMYYHVHVNKLRFKAICEVTLEHFEGEFWIWLFG